MTQRARRLADLLRAWRDPSLRRAGSARVDVKSDMNAVVVANVRRPGAQHGASGRAATRVDQGADTGEAADDAGPAAGAENAGSEAGGAGSEDRDAGTEGRDAGTEA